jgi:fumarate reductase subunit D
MDWRPRNEPTYWGFAVNRVSGLLLTLFLPLHFWALSQAIRAEAELDAFLLWTEHPLVKAGELVLVLLLAAHFAGGLRLLALEFFGWREWQKAFVAVSAGLTFAYGLAFLLNVA